MDRVWRESPMAALRAWQEGAAGLRVEPNEAARRWGAMQGFAGADWRALAVQGLAAQADDAELPIGPARLPLRCRRIRLPDGALWWLAPLRAADDGARRPLADELDLVQAFGRMGLFVRDLDTGEEHADGHVHRLLGLGEDGGSLDFSQALRRCVHPADVEALAAHHREPGSTQQPGSLHFRIVRPDGEVRHLHSLCELRPGGPGRRGRMVGVIIDDTEVTQRIAVERRANEVLERALELAGVSVWRIDLQRQRIHFNAVGFHVMGMDHEQGGIAVADMRDSIHPDDLAAVVAAAEEAVAGDQVVDVVARYRNRDGSWRTLLTRRVADRDESGAVTALAGISLDISQQRVELERAEALAARARLAAEAIGVGFWSREGEFGEGAVHWDEQMYRIHRRDPALGPPPLPAWIPQFVHPHDQGWMSELQSRSMAQWESATDVTFRAPDGDDGERWVQAWTRRVLHDGRRLSFGMHLDVTDSRRAQALLQHERDRQQFAINAAGIGVWERAADGTITYWNEAMYRLRGLDPADPRRREDLLEATSHPDDHGRMVETLLRQLEAGESTRMEYRVRGPDGGWRWLATQGHAVRAADGRLLGLAGVNLDITERQRADALLLEKQRAEQASRDKSAFMARMSHELRTPMNAVLGFAQLLEDDAADPPSERQRARLLRIRQAGSQLMAMIEDVLDLARLDTEAPAAPAAPVPVAAVVLEVIEAVSALAGRHGQQLQLGELPVAAFVRAEGHRLAQALGQLAAHVVRGRDRPGRLQVSAALSTANHRREVVFSLRSDGPAMTPAVLASLFEPPSHRPAPADDDLGAGLGLSLARRAIEAMGGVVEVESSEGTGTWFRARLPAVDGAAAIGPAPPEPRSPPAQATAPAGNGPLAAAAGAGVAAAPLRLLCVEDNPVNLLLVRELLAMRPAVSLSAAVDGASGLAMARVERPDVVLLDLSLPDIDGVEVLRHLRSDPLLQGTVFIALSANAMPGDIQAALSEGFAEYWTKPIDFGQFLSGIDRLVAARRR